MKYIGIFTCTCGIKKIVAGSMQLDCACCGNSFLRKSWSTPACPLCGKANPHLSLPEEYCRCGSLMQEVSPLKQKQCAQAYEYPQTQLKLS